MSVPVSVTLDLKKATVNAKTRTVTGWVTVVTRDDGDPVIDADDHLLPVQVLKRAVQDAFLDNSGAGKVGVNHEDENKGAADLVESFVVTKDNRAALGLGKSHREGWIATIRVNDPEVIERIESGELAELSLLGEATDWEEVEVDAA